MSSGETFSFSDMNFMDDFNIQTVISETVEKSVNNSKKKYKTCKTKEFAERIATADSLIKQIQILENDRLKQNTLLQEIQETVSNVKKMYENEKGERMKLQKLLKDKERENIELDKKIVNTTFQLEQLQAQCDDNQCPIPYNELAKRFLKFVGKVNQEEMISANERSIIYDIINYCKKKGMRVPSIEFKTTPKKSNNKRKSIEKGTQCIMPNMEEKCTQTTQCNIKPLISTHTQGTQHISTTTTRSTSTICFIQKRSIGTIYPEPDKKPAISHILNEIAKWQKITPVSPIEELESNEISTVSETSPVTYQTIGTCTNICNVRRHIDYQQILLPSAIKKSDSRPSSRLMFENIKPEPFSLPKFKDEPSSLFSYIQSGIKFEELWYIFGQILRSLVQDNKNLTIENTLHQENCINQNYQNWLQSFAVNSYMMPTENANKPNYEDFISTLKSLNENEDDNEIVGLFRKINEDYRCSDINKTTIPNDKQETIRSVATSPINMLQLNQNSDINECFGLENTMDESEEKISEINISEHNQQHLKKNIHMSSKTKKSEQIHEKDLEECHNKHLAMDNEKITVDSVQHENHIKNQRNIEITSLTNYNEIASIDTLKENHNKSRQKLELKRLFCSDSSDESNTDVDEEDVAINNSNYKRKHTNEIEISMEKNEELQIFSKNIDQDKESEVVETKRFKCDNTINSSECSKHKNIDEIIEHNIGEKAISSNSESNVFSNKKHIDISDSQMINIIKRPYTQDEHLMLNEDLNLSSDEELVIDYAPSSSSDEDEPKIILNKSIDYKNVRVPDAKYLNESSQSPTKNSITERKIPNNDVNTVSIESLELCQSNLILSPNPIIQSLETASSIVTNLLEDDIYESPQSPLQQNSLDSEYVREIPLICDLTRTDHKSNKPILQNIINNFSNKDHVLINSMKDKGRKLFENHLSNVINQYYNKIIINNVLDARETIRTLNRILSENTNNYDNNKIDDCISTVIIATIKTIEKDSKIDMFERSVELIRQIQLQRSIFIANLIISIEFTLFKGNDIGKLPVNVCVHLTKLYLFGLNDSNVSGFQLNPSRLFICKCLYYHKLKAHPMIYEVLKEFPTVLPHRNEKTYDRSDPLITVIQHLLMSNRYDMNNQQLLHKEILSKLRFEYHFEPFKPDLNDVLNNLMDKLRQGYLNNVSIAFSLLCKQLKADKVKKDILDELLIPLAYEYYTYIEETVEYDERISNLLECISMILKPFPLSTNIESYTNIFKRFLWASNRSIIQQSAVESILRLQRFGCVKCYNALKHFNPSYELNVRTEAMLKTFIHRKPLIFWKKL